MLQNSFRTCAIKLCTFSESRHFVLEFHKFVPTLDLYPSISTFRVHFYSLYSICYCESQLWPAIVDCAVDCPIPPLTSQLCLVVLWCVHFCVVTPSYLPNTAQFEATWHCDLLILTTTNQRERENGMIDPRSFPVPSLAPFSCVALDHCFVHL